MKNLSSRPATLLLLLLVTVTVLVHPIRGQQVSTPAPQTQVLRIIVYSGDLAALLRQLAGQFGVTIGFEADPRQPQPQVKFEAQDVTFHDVLNGIVRAQPSYQWREVDGSVDFYPVAGGSPLLDIPIGKFQVNDADWDEANNALMSLPEVQSNMSALRLSRREAGRGSAGRSGDVFSLRVEDVTVRRALHEIAKKSGSHFWIFRQYGGSEKSFSLGNSER